MQKECQHCGAMMKKTPSMSMAYWTGRKYCSNKCSLVYSSVNKQNRDEQKRVENYKKTREKTTKTKEYTCVLCNKTFSRHFAFQKRAKVISYCSLECKSQAHALERVIINCKKCGKERSVAPWETGVKRSYCSKACWSDRQETHDVECTQCKNLFTVPKNQKTVNKYCSKECGHLAISTSQHYRWKGKAPEGRLRDGIANTIMHRKWRKAIKLRDKNKCTECSSTERLHVHHIYPMQWIIRDEQWSKERWGDLYKETNSKLWDVTNGVTLCEDCHYTLISTALAHKYPNGVV